MSPPFKPIEECFLYTFLDFAFLGGRGVAEVTEKLCLGGADLIQLRAKGASVETVLHAAEEMMPACQTAGVGLVINDFPEVARQVGALACHLGQEDFFDPGHRQAAEITGQPPAFKLGLSTHTPAQAERALAAAPDYIAIGPVHATATKAGAPAVGLDYVRWAAKRVDIPWFAIGGITLENIDAVLAAGARRIAVVSAILKANDLVLACHSFKNRLASAPIK